MLRWYDVEYVYVCFEQCWNYARACMCVCWLFVHVSMFDTMQSHAHTHTYNRVFTMNATTYSNFANYCVYTVHSLLPYENNRHWYESITFALATEIMTVWVCVCVCATSLVFVFVSVILEARKRCRIQYEFERPKKKKTMTADSWRLHGVLDVRISMELCNS